MRLTSKTCCRFAILIVLVAGTVVVSSRGEDPQREKSDGKRPDIAPPTKEELLEERMLFMKSASA